MSSWLQRQLANRFGPFKVLLVLEIIWITYFGALVIVMQTAGDSPEAALLRDGLIKIAFHAGSPYAMLSVIEHGVVAWAPFFWVVFAFWTDLFSTLDVWVYVAARVTEPPAMQASKLPALKGLVLMAILLSTLTVVWYGGVLVWQMCTKTRSGSKRNEDEEPLIAKSESKLLFHVPVRN